MRKLSLSSMLFLLNLAFAYGQPGSIDNYTFFKLYVVNDRDEVLLVKWKGEWEIAGERFNKPTSITAYIDSVANSMGISVGNPELVSMFTQQSSGQPNVTIMQYYKVKYLNGTPKPPLGCTEIKWFTHSDALSVIPYDIMRSVISNVRKNPGKIMSAHFRINRDGNGKIVNVEGLDKFFMLSN